MLVRGVLQRIRLRRDVILTVDELVSGSMARGLPVSRRQVEEWTRAGLLPDPVRTPLPGQGRGRAPYRYPTSAIDAVCVLARWRRYMPSDAEQIRGWLWLTGCEGVVFEPDSYFQRWAGRQWILYQRDNPMLPPPDEIVAGLSSEKVDEILDAQPVSTIPEQFSGIESMALAQFGILPLTAWTDYDKSAAIDLQLAKERGQSDDTLTMLDTLTRFAAQLPGIPSILGEQSIKPETFHRLLAAQSLPHALQAQLDWSFIREFARTVLALADNKSVATELPFLVPVVCWFLNNDPGYVMQAFHTIGRLFTEKQRGEIVRGLGDVSTHLRTGQSTATD